MRSGGGVGTSSQHGDCGFDAVGRMDVVYDEVSEALGEEPGFFDAAQFEESMSTHYGRMVHLDDRTIMFANPEDAAEYIGFDLTAS